MSEPTEKADGMWAMELEALAKLFYENPERLAPTFGYETRKTSASPWEVIPYINITYFLTLTI